MIRKSPTRLLISLLLSLLAASPALAAKKDSMNESMMGENISGGFGDFAIQRKSTFTRQSNEVIWFASFKGFIGAPNAKLNAKWITPAGEIFKDENFTTKYGNARFGWAKLDIRGADEKALELEGEWTVQIYWDEELIDTKKFYLGEKKFIKIQETEQTVPQTVSLPVRLSDPVPSTHLNQSVSTANIVRHQEPLASQASAQETGRYIRTIENDQIVYEGPEKIDPTVWEIERRPFGELQMEGDASAAKSIAILVYPYNLDIVTFNSFGFNRAGYMANEIKKTGLRINPVVIYHTFPEQYKYSLRYNLDRKNVETNFLSDDIDFGKLIDYSEQTKLMKGNPYGNGEFPHDLSGQVAGSIGQKFASDGYRVLDLTKSRDDLSGKSLDEIMSAVHKKYGVNRIMFVPIRAYTKWVWDFGTSKRTEIGLLLCYASIIFEHDKADPIFMYTDNVDIANSSYGFLGRKNKSIPGLRINFYTEDWSEDRKIHPDRPIKFYKDGVLDDLWAARAVIDKFSGQASSSSINENNGGLAEAYLFQKLREDGLLSSASV